jgi:predicted DNA-binding protein (MmcQ/YjbR family)
VTGRRRSTRDELIAFGLDLPEAWADQPWGETALKVHKKVFLFAGVDEAPEPHRISVKLPDSAEEALGFPGAEPTGYGLGRSGWVTIPIASVPIGLLTDWVEESYRCIAPKKLVARLDAARPAEPG